MSFAAGEHLGKTWELSTGRRALAGPFRNKRLENKRLESRTVPHPGLFSLRNFPGNPAKLAAVPAGRTFLPGHWLDVGIVQRGCRPEAVELDADGAAIAARANDDPFPAGEIWASRSAEYGHPDAGPFRPRRQLIGWPFMRSHSRTKRLCGVHLRARRGNTFSLECMAGNPPAHRAIDEWRRSGGDRGRLPMPDVSFHREHGVQYARRAGVFSPWCS